MIVRIRKTDARLRVEAGEVYEAKRYWLDPSDKVTLISRVPDGFDPMCNQYAHEVDHRIDGEWCRLEGARYAPIVEREIAREEV